LAVKEQSITDYKTTVSHHISLRALTTGSSCHRVRWSYISSLKTAVLQIIEMSSLLIPILFSKRKYQGPLHFISLCLRKCHLINFHCPVWMPQLD